MSQRRSSMSFSRGKEAAAVADVGAADVQLLGERGRGAEERQRGSRARGFAGCVAGRFPGRGQGAGFNAATSSARLRFAISCSVIPAVRRPSSLNCFRVKGGLAHVSLETGSASPRIIRPSTP